MFNDENSSCFPDCIIGVVVDSTSSITTNALFFLSDTKIGVFVTLPVDGLCFESRSMILPLGVC